MTQRIEVLESVGMSAVRLDRILGSPIAAPVILMKPDGREIARMTKIQDHWFDFLPQRVPFARAPLRRAY